MDPVKRISEMEKILNDHNDLIEELRAAIEKFADHQEEYMKLSNYYSSQEYFDDLEIRQGRATKRPCLWSPF